MITKTKLQRVNEFPESEWVEDYGLTAAEYQSMLAVQESGQDVVVECEACDGYYDLTLPNGTALAAISGYHLVDLALMTG